MPPEARPGGDLRERDAVCAGPGFEVSGEAAQVLSPPLVIEKADPDRTLDILEMACAATD